MSDNENDKYYHENLSYYEINKIYYNETVSYYQKNIDKLRKYNRDYYHFRQKTNPLYFKKNQPYISGKKIMCIKCGATIREKYIQTHMKTKSCKYPLTLPLKKRNLINLKEQLNSDDDEYFKL